MHTDLSCVTNLADKKPAAWKRDWLDNRGLMEACKERDIALPSSSSGVCSLADRDLKILLQPFHSGEKCPPDTSFDLFVVVATKASQTTLAAKQSKSKKTKNDSESFVTKIELLSPSVFRDNKKENEFVLDTSHTGEVVTTFELQCFPKSEEQEKELIEVLREKVLETYQVEYRGRNFDKEAMFFQSRSNSLKMTHLDNDATLRSKLESLLSNHRSIKISVGAAHTLPKPHGSDDYPVDSSGHHIPPVLPDTRKTAAARVQHESEEKANSALKVLYFNENSPLYHGFDVSHQGFIKTYLTSHEGKKLLESLLQSPPVFNIPDLNGYLSLHFQSWNHQLVLKTTGSIPARDKFPPTAGKEDEIPQKTFPADRPGGGGGGGADNKPSMVDGLLALAGAVSSSKPSAAPIVAHQNHISSYASLEQFLNLAGVPKDHQLVLTSGEINTLDILHELVSEANKSKDDFAVALLSYINEQSTTTIFSKISCVKILGQSKKAPPLP